MNISKNNKKHAATRIACAVLAAAVFSAGALLASCAKKDAAASSDVALLHVSFDVAREIAKELGAGFAPWYKEKTGVTVQVEQSNGGSTRQARAVAEGLPADVVSMNQYLDIDLLYEQTKDNPEGAIIPQDWQSKYPNNSSPASSTMAFVVRKGNPKNIRDWSDLAREGVEIVAPNYRATGNGRYSLLTAYAYGLNKYNGGGTEQDAYNFVKKVIQNTVVIAEGGRAASNVFIERGVGDVLLTFEAEVNLIVRDLASQGYEVVVPSYGADAKIYVVVVDAYAKQKGEANYEAAKAFWDFIYTDAGQEIVAKTFYRPINKDIAAKYKDTLPDIELFDIEKTLGPWPTIQSTLFSDDGVVQKIYEELGKN